MSIKDLLREYARLSKETQTGTPDNPLLKGENSTPLSSAQSFASTPNVSISEEDFLKRFFKALEDLDTETGNLREELNELKDEHKKFNEEFKKEKDQVKVDDEKLKEDMKKEIEASKLGVVEPLVVFVAFFTLVAVNITIYTKVEYLSSALWFMFLMTICLCIVILIFSMLIRNEFNGRKLVLAGFLVISIIFSLIYLNNSYNKNDFIINPPAPTTIPTPTTIVPTATIIPTFTPTPIISPRRPI